MNHFTITSVKSKDLYTQYKALNTVITCNENEFRTIISKLSGIKIKSITFKGIVIKKDLR